MVFSSLTFMYIYLPIVLGIYFILPRNLKNLWMFIAGLFFYAWGEPIYLWIMVLSTFIDYAAGYFMYKFDYSKKIRTICLLCSVVMNLSLLSIFKYSAFFVSSINSIFGLSLTVPSIALPIGISFYTFQSMSYTIDLYMRNISVQKNPITFATYVTLFPQIVAGPIVRYQDIQNEIETRSINIDLVGEGAIIFVKGLAKKVLLANNIGALWSTIKAQEISELPALTAWIGILAFTFQIYFDFSGYSDMAVGLGKVLGFNFPNNFNFPYISKSIAEFWRRWHITLGTWFREYVYIPLGGNRKGMLRTVINLFITWMLTGFWHGASWNFVIWGIYFGVLIILERLFLGNLLKKIPAILQVLYTFVLVVFGWVLFEFDKMANVFAYFKAMFGGNSVPLANSNTLYYIISYLIVFALCIFFSSDISKKIIDSISNKFPRFSKFITPVITIVLLLICTAYLVDATYNPFLYFRF